MGAPKLEAMETFTSQSPAETAEIARQLASRLTAGACVGVVGPLGAGKTVFVRGAATGLGLDDEKLVTSPTFVLVQEYPGRLPIYHLDLYRLADAPQELAGLGIREMMQDGVVLIEWADRAGDALPAGAWNVQIEVTGPDSRTIRVEAST